jgi:hypothetical protein
LQQASLVFPIITALGLVYSSFRIFRTRPRAAQVMIAIVLTVIEILLRQCHNRFVPMHPLLPYLIFTWVELMVILLAASSVVACVVHQRPRPRKGT